MVPDHNEPGSLRFSRRESGRVVAALLLSLLAHLSAWSGYEAGKKAGLWEKMHVPEWLQPPAKKYALKAQLAHDSEPDIFVDVSHADADAPVRPKYYSNKNSRAANPDVGMANVPSINGSQTVVPKTEDAPRAVRQPREAPAPEEMPKPEDAPKPASKPDDPPKAETTPPKNENVPQLPKLQPSAPPQLESMPLPRLAQAETPEPPQTPGDLDPIKPRKKTLEQPFKPQPQQSERPRTLRQALAKRDQIPGQQSKQEGGVARQAIWSSLDVKATPFGDYDRAIIESVTQRWYDLLDSRRFAQDRSGKVMLRFKLKYDGTIIEMHTLENTVGELLGYLCQEAIEEAAPFATWPPDMVRMIGANYREITFTFYYY